MLKTRENRQNSTRIFENRSESGRNRLPSRVRPGELEYFTVHFFDKLF
jgi:hypothetical protein